MSSKKSRIPSGKWSRLKPVVQDPLEEMGLPSKGDSRLQDHKTQEKYYSKIIERYMTFCADAGQRDELLERFSSLEIQDNSAPDEPDTNTLMPTRKSADALRNSPNTKTLATIMAALRKLREGIVASQRADKFAVQAYLFCIRLSVLVQQPESYHPAILHLLRRIHPIIPLSSIELHETVSYLVLDAACRRRDFAEAYSIRLAYGLKDSKVNAALSALAHDNYIVYHRVRRAVDGHRARIMEWGTAELRLHTLKCFGSAYLGVDLDYLQTATDSKWDELKQNDGVGWELDGSRVTIRKLRAR
ncbi:hypothetical protein K4F52_000767 [Lecanicillium sp. MT-2017a]|nr:hypothetical protein K4F52_000767 [Lecanicillium sp. MT-2017a]